MLLFIACVNLFQATAPEFQYISCYSLSVTIDTKDGRAQSFNTSHVTLYQGVVSNPVYLSVFQYISCYSLSYSRLPLCQGLRSFQYISCYSLSLIPKLLVSVCLLFQYISCYSLSNVQRRNWPRRIRFNTSHVTLYLRYLGHRS